MSLALLNEYGSDSSSAEEEDGNQPQSPAKPIAPTKSRPTQRVAPTQSEPQLQTQPPKQARVTTPAPKPTPKPTPKPQSAVQKRRPKPKGRRRERVQSKQGWGELPEEVARELEREGHALDTATLTEVDARAGVLTASRRPDAAGPTHVPAHVVHKAVERLSKGAGVSRRERQKHQITALAADAAALQTARETFGNVPGRSRRG